MTVGDAVYIPPYAFHWTEVLDRPSVALSVGFSTRASIASAEIYDFDRRLRRRGLRSRPRTPFSLSGRAKAALERVARARSTRPPRVTGVRSRGGGIVSNVVVGSYGERRPRPCSAVWRAARLAGGR